MDQGRHSPMKYAIQIQLTYYLPWEVMIFGVVPIYFDISEINVYMDVYYETTFASVDYNFYVTV